jgi:NAD(P)-dependent dehydrogenase (short-subunit alcohol dehydrogenase family)
MFLKEVARKNNMSKFDLKDKTVVITGASGGIGGEAAVAYARRGAKLVLSGRNMEALEKVAERVREAGAEAHIVPADVASNDEVKALVEKAVDLTGGLDVMFLCAGYELLGEIGSMTMEMWQNQMDVNFWGVLYGFYAALPHFIKQGSGQFIIVNSLSGRMGMGLSGPYSASKFALWGFADCVRCELREKNIDLLAVYPYFVKTSFQANIRSPNYRVPPDLAKRMLGQSPVKLAKKIVRAGEKRKGELLCTPLGWMGPRLVPLSFHLSEWIRRLLLPITRRILGADKEVE